ncbi:No apical meristem-associated C-terminal domain-containing protein [Circinella umbellata]|nr:No apical meristem-associated C-terminal domain-containing protein [Circinella umbellata]
MYSRFEKKPFGLEHCWAVLRGDEKWKSRAKELKDKQTASKKKKEKKKEVSPAAPNVAPADQDADTSSGAKPQPVGNKKAKEQEAYKRKLDQALEHEWEFLKESKKRTKYLEELVMERKKETKEKKNEAKEDQRRNDYNIMSMDLSKLDPLRRQYFEHEMKKILARSLKEQVEEDDNEEVNDDEDEDEEQEQEQQLVQLD